MKKKKNKTSNVKQKSTFAYARNGRIHIILRMRKVSSVPLHSIDTFYNI